MTLRLAGIGKSALVDLIGEDVLRRPNPEVATYARVDAVDVVVSAELDGRLSPQELVDQTIDRLRERIGRYVFAEGDKTWAEAIAAVIGSQTLSIVEIGTAGQLGCCSGTHRSFASRSCSEMTPRSRTRSTTWRTTP